MTTKEQGRVSIKDVAERAGVSIGTVSNVVNRPDRVAASTRDRVQAAIDALGYVRSESARHLRAGRSRMIAMLALDMTNPFFADVAHGAEEAATADGLGVMLCSSGQDAEVESLYLSLFAEQRVRGVLIAPTAAGSVEVLARQGIPHVVVDGNARGAACSVSVDDVVGGELAARHLVEAGHRRIAYVTGPLDLPQCRDRRIGASEAAELVVLETPTMDVAGGRDAGSRLLGLPDRPTAVFCANDLLALGVLQALFAAGVRVPDDLALVGYDDIEFAAAAAVPLTSVRRPARRLGRTAADLLLRESDDSAHRHEHIVYQPELVVRRSSLAQP
ncbi:LacI family DNA-binding transcriptional regulator [Saccharopolyspora mangrovi]|uniref:LacI family DNA-binding transcriptional regulator n=1 Tax=Saccharopolyspora mangrovi TaxID=3082379 RepID=A0ABU6AFP8_9PSEU|nr:LacI family DNA-binding transcriptional regulator [Saccharopolyspora sp. S2-29]MEB3370389.1 LacI family DNA-binding transcriptional regulator [Saccharopolyspora sp. S2-29]